MDKDFILVDANTRHPIEIGDRVSTFKGEQVTLTDWDAPSFGWPTGKVYVSRGAPSGGYLPSVINALIIKRP